jgi:hypothetical protein
MKLNKLLLLIIFSFSCLLSSSTFASSSTLFGTEGFRYSFLINEAWSGKLYHIKDIRGESVEEGFSFKSGPFLFKTSKTSKDTILNNSTLTKAVWNYSFPLGASRLESKCVLGYMYLPSMFSSWTNFRPSQTSATVLHISQKIERETPMFDWNLEAKLNYVNNSTKYPYPDQLDNVDVFSFTYLQSQAEILFKRPIVGGNTGILGSRGLARTSSYFPLDIFINQEIEVGISNSFLSMRYFYPTSLQLLRENYPYQGKRLELKAALELPFLLRLNSEAVFGETDHVYSFILAKDLGHLNIGLMLNRDYFDQRIGIQCAIGEDNIVGLGKYYIAQESIPNSPVTYAFVPAEPQFSEAVTAATSFDQLANNLDTPEKVAWYTADYIKYAPDHNNISGMWVMYSPEEVFNNKKGNCTEKARFQANILNKHGYEVMLLCYQEREIPHAVAAYKDPITQKWNILENIGPYLFYTQTKDPLAALTQTNPSWLSVTFKDISGKGLQQIDSTTKWYIQDWFEKD